jgi:hypothetical protein
VRSCAHEHKKRRPSTEDVDGPTHPSALRVDYGPATSTRERLVIPATTACAPVVAPVAPAWREDRALNTAQSDVAGTLAVLERALALAEPQGYVRMFVDEGAPMVESLRQAQARGSAPAYVALLLAACSTALAGGGQ